MNNGKFLRNYLLPTNWQQQATQPRCPFNGEAVFQYKLKTAEKRLENRPHFIVGVADGISN
ncbi:hypothetical protein, partial [Streptococcus pneumoniae]|uniref:hypothetical protein n=1 Tax=Streptococcus pneumoniae TaxID=1313 RepID=UPI0019549A03